MRITVTGCNHKTAPVQVRERIAFDAEQAAAALAALKQRFPESEAVLLSTCNRVELYVARPVHGHPRTEEAAEFLAGFHGLSAAEVASLLYKRRDREAVEHLMRVAGSIDSMVLGETQILGQVRQAFQLAIEVGSIGPVLGRLCQDAIAAGKRIHTQTSLSAGRVSVASVAVQFARQIFADFADKTVLIVGAGKMGVLTVRRLMELGPGRLVVTNRSAERARRLAERFGGEVAPFEQLTETLARADIVITSTGSPAPLIGPEQVRGLMKARRYRPIFLIDIAVPRDIDPAVGQLEQVYLYNIDDLQKAVESNLDGRASRLADAEQIVAEQVEEFLAWLRSRSVGPTIAALRHRLEAIKAGELDWLMPKLTAASPRDRELVEQFARRLINKVLHEPIRQLSRHAPQPREPQSLNFYAHTLIRLFALDSEEPADEQPKQE